MKNQLKLTPTKIFRSNKESFVISRYGLLTEGRLIDEYLNIDHPIEKLCQINDQVDVISFPQRSFFDNIEHYPFYSKTETIGLLTLENHDMWFNNLRKSERRLIRKARQLGIETHIRRKNENDNKAIFNLYHETPVRQGMIFSPYFGYSKTNTIGDFAGADAESLMIAVAYLDGRLVGLLCCRVGTLGARFQTFISTSRRIPGLNNLLIDCIVNAACERKLRFIVYGHMNIMPSLDEFKIHNGFRPHSERRYYVPLTQRGAALSRLGLCLEPWELFPKPIFNIAYSFKGLFSRLLDLSPAPTDRYVRLQKSEASLSNSESGE
ncbi:MAG: hypothetical protein NWE93_06055 [Candidatus Bathyarchaeota archaeon]|nr:hypothetical protein [Candidatus Bathyarchaeota archaeon]